MKQASILAATLAGIILPGTALAGDLPMSKAETAEYVKICSAFGADFFYIPGADTCLRISGQIQADYFYLEPHSRDDDQTAFSSQARIRFDARTTTDYGVLRSFIEFQADAKDSTTSLAVRRAFLQLGGLTAGYTWSPFSFFDQYYADQFFAPYYGEQGRRDLLSYTLQYGKAWVALSIEDGRSHRSGDTFGGPNGEIGGNQVPDILGVIGYDDNENGWGRVQMMAAVHQDRTADPRYDTKFGYAIGIGGNINIPLLSGAYVAAELDYADGAVNYLNAGAADAYTASVAPFELELGKGFSIEGEAAVNLTPALQAMLFGSYLKYDAPGIAVAASDNFRSYAVGGQLTYTVVKGFIAGTEVWYQDKDADGTSLDVHSVGAGVRLRRTF
jgi:Porin subfamily